MNETQQPPQQQEQQQNYEQPQYKQQPQIPQEILASMPQQPQPPTPLAQPPMQQQPPIEEAPPVKEPEKKVKKAKAKKTKPKYDYSILEKISDRERFIMKQTSSKIACELRKLIPVSKDMDFETLMQEQEMMTIRIFWHIISNNERLD